MREESRLQVVLNIVLVAAAVFLIVASAARLLQEAAVTSVHGSATDQEIGNELH